MPNCPSRPSDRRRFRLPPTAALLSILLSGAAQAQWFGPPCPEPALIPVRDDSALLRLRRDPLEAGEDVEVRILRDGGLQLAPWTLERAGLSTAGLRHVVDGRGGVWVTLGDVPGLEYRYDGCTQELLLDTRAARRAANVVFAGRPSRPGHQRR
jgi:hypothetical protein